MTTNKVRPKRILAREILLFFCGLGLFAIIWGFLALRNTYYNHKASSYSADIQSLQHQLDTLPTDYLKEFYELTSRYFVVGYKLGEHTYVIPKEQEKEFLTDEYGIQKKVISLPIHSKGYSNFKQSDPLNILDKDSAIVFDYVLFDKFREFVELEDYQNKLFSVFSNSPDQNGTVTVNSLIEKPKFDPMKRYNGIFDLGTLSQFKNRIRKGLSYNVNYKEKKQIILSDINKKQKQIIEATGNVLDTKEINRVLLIVIIVIGVLFYPLRLSVYSINWALNTLKHY